MRTKMKKNEMPERLEFARTHLKREFAERYGIGMNLYERFYKKLLPKDLQEKTESFASQGKSTGEVLFRIGYYLGRNFEKYRDELIEVEEWQKKKNLQKKGRQNDRG